MGLDISYYANAEFVALTSDLNSEAAYERGLVYVHTLFPHSLPVATPDSWYKADYVGGFRAGSCSSYNAWRESLCLAVHGMPIAELWRDNDVWRDKPFYRLLNFADNEGVFDWKASESLASDFKLRLPRRAGRGDDYWRAHYDAWKRAFETAAGQHGLVCFH